MYEISIQTEFCAAHAIMFAGTREPVHGHNWHVTVTIAGPTLDADGLLIDFHAAERSLRDITGPFHNADLNALAPFRDGLNPSAENVARHIFERLRADIADVLRAGVRVVSVRVTEAPGCAAVYRPEPS